MFSLLLNLKGLFSKIHFPFQFTLKIRDSNEVLHSYAINVTLKFIMEMNTRKLIFYDNVE
jgi:hypothetical protein